MKTQQSVMKPQDIVILMKIIAYGENSWSQLQMANQLFMSQSEISQSLARSKYAGLLHTDGKSIHRISFMEFLQFGIKYVFPQTPGPIVRGVPTAHSAPPLDSIIQSEEKYVWPSGKGTARGHSIIPLFSSVVDAVKLDSVLYELLALIDSLRVGRAREKELAITELRNRIIDGE